MRIVEIEWADSERSEDGWFDLSDPILDSDLTCRSVGYVLGETKDRWMLIGNFSSLGDGEQGCHRMTIPKVAVLSVTELKPELKSEPYPGSVAWHRAQ